MTLSFRLLLLLNLFFFSVTTLFVTLESPPVIPFLSVSIDGPRSEAAIANESPAETAFYNSLEAEAEVIHNLDLKDPQVRAQALTDIRTQLRTIQTFRTQIQTIQARQLPQDPSDDVVEAMKGVPRDIVNSYDRALTIRNAYLSTAVEQAYDPSIANAIVKFFNGPQTNAEIKSQILSAIGDSIGFLVSQEEDWSILKNFVKSEIQKPGNAVKQEAIKAFIQGFRPFKDASDVSFISEKILGDPQISENEKLKALANISPLASNEGFSFLESKLRGNNTALKNTAEETFQRYDISQNTDFIPSFKQKIEQLKQGGVYHSKPTLPPPYPPRPQTAEGSNDQFLAQATGGTSPADRCLAQSFNANWFRTRITGAYNSSADWYVSIGDETPLGTESDYIPGNYVPINFSISSGVLNQDGTVRTYTGGLSIKSTNHRGTGINSGSSDTHPDVCLYDPDENNPNGCFMYTDSGSARQTPGAPYGDFPPIPPSGGGGGGGRNGGRFSNSTCHTSVQFRRPFTEAQCHLYAATYDGAAELKQITPWLSGVTAPHSIIYPTDQDRDHLQQGFEYGTVIKDTSGNYMRMNDCSPQTILGVQDVSYDQDVGYREFAFPATTFVSQPVGDKLTAWEEMRGLVPQNGPVIRDLRTGIEARLTQPINYINAEQRFPYYTNPLPDSHGSWGDTWPGVKQLFINNDYYASDTTYHGPQSFEYMLGTQLASVDLLDPSQRNLCREGYCDLGRTVNFNDLPYINRGFAINRVPAVRIRSLAPNDLTYDEDPNFDAITVTRHDTQSVFDDFGGLSLPILFSDNNMNDLYSVYGGQITNFNQRGVFREFQIHELDHKLGSLFDHEPRTDNLPLIGTLQFPDAETSIISWVNENGNPQDPSRNLPNPNGFYWVRTGPEPGGIYTYYAGFWSLMEATKVPLRQIEYVGRTSGLFDLTRLLFPRPINFVPTALQGRDDARSYFFRLSFAHPSENPEEPPPNGVIFYNTSADPSRTGQGSSYRNVRPGILEPDKAYQPLIPYGAVDLYRSPLPR